jgi:hypothetical protein
LVFLPSARYIFSLQNNVNWLSSTAGSFTPTYQTDKRTIYWLSMQSSNDEPIWLTHEQHQ